MPARRDIADVLIACVRDPAEERTADVLRDAVCGVTDPEALALAALRHGMSGLLFRRVSTLCPDAVSPDTLESLRRRSADVAVRGLRMQRDLLDVMGGLEAAGIRAIALKGAAIALQVYGDSTVRNSVDVDVLVAPSAVSAAREVVLGLGYRDMHEVEIDARLSGLVLEREQELGFRHPRTGTDLELHWRIGPRFASDSLDARGIFERAEEVEILGRRIQSLGRLDVILALAVHMAEHEWLRIEDVAALSAALGRVDDADAVALENLAFSSGCLRRLHVGALLAESLGGASIPPNLAASARFDGAGGRLARWAEAGLLKSLGQPEDLEPPGPLERAKGVLRQARSLDTRRAAARHAWRRLVEPGVRDNAWSRETSSSPLARLAVQLKRQVRLWLRNGG